MASSNALAEKAASQKARLKQELRTRRELRAMFTFRPKLSLRGLLLLVLASGSAMAFYLHFQPWAPTRYLRGHADSITALVWSPDGRSLLSTSRDRTARLWDAEKGTTTRVLAAHEDWVTCADISTDGKRAITGSADETARVWNLETGENELTLQNSFCGEFFTVKFSPDGQALLTTSADGLARVWDAELGQQRTVYSGLGYWMQRQTLTVSAQYLNEKQVALTTADGYVAVWERHAGKPSAFLQSDRLVFRAATFNRGGTCVISAGDHCTAQVWMTAQQSSPDTRRKWSARHAATLRGHTGAVLGGNFSPDERRLLTLSADGTARVWSMLDFSLLGVLENGTAVQAAVFSPDGSRIAMSDGRQIAIWEQRRPEPLWGVIAMPEFWATAIFTVLFVVIAWRDRKGVAANPPEPEKTDKQRTKAVEQPPDTTAETVTAEVPKPET